ncbi:hypothetical protein GTQ99_11210 [Kineococcus sp. T13]|uniref:hypothetical protein n=1 Tax=Kineococcus vitellinus TaxID=2696565 RepID=UPI0014126175|nr:hypothetical protein [Kineococcus vitellinus]NAZ75976.1 hypothetical protein [Kineococcus vitellinus]
MSTPTREVPDVPEAVLLLLERAVGGDLLGGGVEAMAAALAATGWVRGVGSGSWSCAADPSWSVQSAGLAPGLSVVCTGGPADLLHLTGALRALLDSGRAGAVRPGEPDPDWRTWSAGRAGEEVVLLLHVGEEHRVNRHLVPALLVLEVERADTPHAGLAPDPERARRLAREGSATTRWYLAGEDHLPEDVVALLAADEDPAVVAALEAGAGRRDLVRAGC